MTSIQMTSNEADFLKRFNELRTKVQQTPYAGVRKTTVEEICDMIHSQNLTVISRVISFLELTFPKYEDLQNTIINAAYDMVEETSQEVRYAGIKFIVGITRRTPSWTRRNVDVLVQLLALEDQEDIKQLFNALEECMKIDSQTTLQVLSSFLDTTIGRETVASTEELRSKILEFLAFSKVKDTQLQDLSSESAIQYRNSVLQALSTAPPTDVDVIVAKLLSPYSLPSEYRRRVIKVLLEKAKNCVIEETTHNPTAPNLETAVSISEATRAIHSKDSSNIENRLILLSFYASPTVIEARSLLPAKHQALFVERLAEAIDVTPQHLNRADEAVYKEARNRVADDCKGWTKVLLTTRDQLWASSVPLLTVILRRRQDESGWKPDEAALQRLVDRLTSPNLPQSVLVHTREALAIIKRIHEPSAPTPAPKPAPTPVPFVTLASTINLSRSGSKRKATSDPEEAPVPMSSDKPIKAIPTLAARLEPAAKSTSLFSRLNISNSMDVDSAPESPSSETDSQGGSRKKRRRSEKESTPSLLSRLGTDAAGTQKVQVPMEVEKKPEPTKVQEKPKAIAIPSPKSLPTRTPTPVAKPVAAVIPVRPTLTPIPAPPKDTAPKSFSIMGAAAAKPSGLSIRGAAAPRPPLAAGALSFQRAVAGISTPKTGLEKLWPTETPASTPVTPTLPAKPQTSSLLARLGDGDQKRPALEAQRTSSGGQSLRDRLGL